MSKIHKLNRIGPMDIAGFHGNRRISALNRPNTRKVFDTIKGVAPEYLPPENINRTNFNWHSGMAVADIDQSRYNIFAIRSNVDPVVIIACRKKGTYLELDMKDIEEDTLSKIILDFLQNGRLDPETQNSSELSL